jgi:hypothetical protein
MNHDVFAFGSNMCLGRIRDYGVRPDGVGRPAVLKGHRLVFNKKSKDNSGKARTGQLSKLRSDNLSYIIDRLIHTRTLINPQRQRRALSMLAVAGETYSRNELTETEALRVIQQSMRITEEGARQMLDELHASILRRTVNGFAFQMRSYGEYLAAEELVSARIERLRELAFLDHDTPNESWTNSVGYLAEMNADVRAFFVRKYPFWMLSSSPAAFSETEKDTLIRTVFEAVTSEDQYVYRHPRVVLSIAR